MVSPIFMSGDHPIRTVSESGTKLARLLAEPGFASALSAVSGGVGPLHDAVHWRQHPLTTAPSGRSDLAAKLGQLRARVYSRPRGDAISAARQSLERHEGGTLVGRSSETALPGSFAPVNVHQNFRETDAAPDVTAASRLAFRRGPDAGLAVRVIG